VSERAGGSGIGKLVELLATGAHRRLRPGTSVTQLDHALQTAALLARAYPDDPELAAAGLVHDIGHLVPGVGDEEHAAAGAAAVRGALGERVAGLVALHVEAKRYLVATEHGYCDGLSPDSVASLAVQGGPFAAAEAGAFGVSPLAHGATALRRADDRAKEEGLVVRGLAHWVRLLRELSERGGRSPR
jgi:predicted HD phosphohydrolase